MLRNKIAIILGLCVFIFACGSHTQSSELEAVEQSRLDSISMDSMYAFSKQNVNFENIMDTLLPYFAKLHDSIPHAKRFDTVYRAAYKIHQKERQLETLYFADLGNNQYSFMMTRLEPSLNKDKYSSFCINFSRDKNGRIDTSTYSEVFWTWKMLKPELIRKSATLFKAKLEGKDLSEYYPQNSKYEFIMFPDERVEYDIKSKTWVPISVKK